MAINKFLQELWTLYYDRTDVSEGIDVNKIKILIFGTIGIF